MAFEDMASELTGYLPKLSKEFAYTLINRAWSKVRDTGIWSFQLGEDGMFTPNVITSGTVTAALASNIIICNSAATTALNGLVNPFLTQRQFRVQGYSIYNMITADLTTNPPFLTITLDRPYVDPLVGPGLTYMVYQSYYPAPVPDFKRWLGVRDMVNASWLSIYESKRDVDMGDPQRLYFTFPRWFIGYGYDQRGAGTQTPSATLGNMLYELYPNPLSQFSYMRWWLRRGSELINPADTLPAPITESMILAKARVYAYEWMEANRDPSVARGQTADFKLLMGIAANEYEDRLKDTRKKDRNLIDLYLARVVRYPGVYQLPYFSTLANRSYYGG